MTAEEVALEEFREAVRGARVARRDASHGSRVALGMHASKLGAVRVIARIIRAIRAEREEREDVAAAYETGRRNALRGVQGAALYHIGGRELDIEACELACTAAKAAEEAAR